MLINGWQLQLKPFENLSSGRETQREREAERVLMKTPEQILCNWPGPAG